MRHLERHPRVPYLTSALSSGDGPCGAVSDWMRAVPDHVRPWVPGDWRHSALTASAAPIPGSRCAGTSASTPSRSWSRSSSSWPRPGRSSRTSSATPCGATASTTLPATRAGPWPAVTHVGRGGSVPPPTRDRRARRAGGDPAVEQSPSTARSTDRVPQRLMRTPAQLKPPESSARFVTGTQRRRRTRLDDARRVPTRNAPRPSHNGRRCIEISTTNAEPRGRLPNPRRIMTIEQAADFTRLPDLASRSLGVDYAIVRLGVPSRPADVSRRRT